MVEATSAAGHRVTLINGGNALNFATDPNVGHVITLLQAEIQLALHRLATSPPSAPNVVNEVSDFDRRAIASAWIEHFLGRMS